MIPKEDVQAKAEEILTSQSTTQYKFLEENTKKFIKYLYTRAPNFWVNFGAYWYHFSEVLKNYAPREYRAYLTAMQIQPWYENEALKKSYDYGSDMNNWVAGMEAMQDRVAMGQISGENSMIEYAGELREFSIETGFVDGEPEQQITEP